jgi:hypothetical protein
MSVESGEKVNMIGEYVRIWKEAVVIYLKSLQLSKLIQEVKLLTYFERFLFRILAVTLNIMTYDFLGFLQALQNR